MGELPLSEQDVDLLITGLESLLQRIEGREDLAALKSSIQSIMERLKGLHCEERAQAIAAIQRALSQIAAELESIGPDAGNPAQD